MMEKLPSEIALEIFSRLPPVSVVLCKLVCKSWCSLLLRGDDDNHFANMHLSRRGRHHQQQQCYLDCSTLNFIALHGEEEGSTIGEFGIIDYDEVVEELNCKVKRLNFSQYFIRDVDRTRLIGSCNGLVCVVTRINYDDSKPCIPILLQDRISICNPLLHEYVTLPLSDLQYDHTSMDIIGFGHNPITDEYKVVRVHYRHFDSVIGDVEVYTLGKSNGMWRSKGTIEYMLQGFPRPMLMNGSIHWLARTWELVNIVSFDLEDEEFRVIPLPSYPHFTIRRGLQLKELRGCLCLIGITRDTWAVNRNLDIWALLRGCLCWTTREVNRNLDIWALLRGCLCWTTREVNRNLDIWVLKYYMNKESWVKEFSIKWVVGGEGESLYLPVAIKKNKNGDGDEILLWYNTERLVSYDPKTQSFEEVVGGRQVVSVSEFDQEPLLYISSLVSLKALGEDANYANSHSKTKAYSWQRK